MNYADNKVGSKQDGMLDQIDARSNLAGSN